MIYKDKRAWIKVLEAFIAVMLIIATLIIVIGKRDSVSNQGEEIILIQKAILDSISKDPAIRGQVLSGQTSLVNKRIENMIPPWLNYSVAINCSYNSICPNPAGYIDKEVYSNEVLITSNLTYFNPSNIVKVKLFFWRK